MKKRARVHLLPADGWQEIGITLHARGKNDTNYTPHNIYITTDDSIKIGDWYTDGVVVNQLQDDELPMSYDRKIIATTDPELNVSNGEPYEQAFIERKRGILQCMSQDLVKIQVQPKKQLPQIPQSFIEEYCKAGGIDEVDVEYGRTMDGTPTYNRLALTSNNEIIIHLIDQEKRDCLIAFDDWFNKNWYPEQYSILAIEAYLKTIQ